MLEPDNDKLEDFFRKATGKADVTFNEEDWRKLEARLEEAETNAVGPNPVNKRRPAIIIGSLLLLAALVLLNMRYEIVGYRSTPSASHFHLENRNTDSSSPLDEHTETSPGDENDGSVINKGSRSDSDKKVNGDSQERSALQSPESQAADDNSRSIRRNANRNSNTDQRRYHDPADAAKNLGRGRFSNPDDRNDLRESRIPANDIDGGRSYDARNVPGDVAVTEMDRENIYDQLIRTTPAVAGKRNEQKANVMLPGAEEVDTGKAETTVKEEHASEIEHVATPRLSLLLSFAPDFTSTSNQYSSPGKAYGLMIHYHLMRRWSISAGVIKNNKVYTGAGEDYKPPKGYWKYYTNGIIPYSIDGACDILEFPVMIQYTIAHYGKSRWLAGAGASSYLMQSESYRYNFEEPNPGAKEGWDSKRSSRFLFNMVNFTVAYERQLMPGLMAGIEPYVKIPVEEIGWSNVRLFSVGASVTLRYKIIGRKINAIPVRSRGPDQN